MNAEIERFIAEYPFLEQYQDYTHFLRSFGGASAGGALMDGPGICEEDYFYVSIYGLGDANPRFLDRAEFDVVDRRGFFGFAEVHYRYKPDREGQSALDGVLAAEFCLSVPDGREEGVYVRASAHL